MDKFTTKDIKKGSVTFGKIKAFPVRVLPNGSRKGSGKWENDRRYECRVPASYGTLINFNLARLPIICTVRYLSISFPWRRTVTRPGPVTLWYPKPSLDHYNISAI